MFQGLRTEFKDETPYLVFSILGNFTTYRPEGDLEIGFLLTGNNIKIYTN